LLHNTRPYHLSYSNYRRRSRVGKWEWVSARNQARSHAARSSCEGERLGDELCAVRSASCLTAGRRRCVATPELMRSCRRIAALSAAEYCHRWLLVSAACCLGSKYFMGSVWEPGVPGRRRAVSDVPEELNHVSTAVVWSGVDTQVRLPEVWGFRELGGKGAAGTGARTAERFTTICAPSGPSRV
jgi:hypothetical protein